MSPVTYPGVYVQELPSSVRTIVGVSTSITAFVGRALKGPADKPTLIHSYAEYERVFGGLWKNSNMSYSVYHYFQNGGLVAVIVRVAKNASEATFTATNAPNLKASNPGLWGEDLVIKISDAEADKLKEDPTYFNLSIHQKTSDQTKLEPAIETFSNVSLNPTSPRYIGKLLADEVSTYLRLNGSVASSTSPLPATTDYQSNKTATDGVELDASAIKGDPDAKTGIYALKNADIFNLLCIPVYDAADTRSSLFIDALDFCSKQRAIFLVDPPAGDHNSWNSTASLPNEISSYVARDANGALFFPRIIAPDPHDEHRPKQFDPCGVVAGVIARTDTQHGVWKAPAGLEATLIGVDDLSVRLTDSETAALNPKGINCLRFFSGVGRVVWGSRTLRGADSLADQWKYLPVRRMALFIEESLYRGTQWVVFEPNDEKLWSQIRLNIGAFMQSLFVKGAFQGTHPRKAYLVKCDSETTTQDDVSSGIVNILVGFAPLKPAEFIILKIQQRAGQERE